MVHRTSILLRAEEFLDVRECRTQMLDDQERPRCVTGRRQGGPPNNCHSAGVATTKCGYIERVTTHSRSDRSGQILARRLWVDQVLLR
jgi:hypothetical protein